MKRRIGKNFIALSLLIGTSFLVNHLSAQKPNELKWNFKEDGSQYFKVTLVNQVWLRYTQTNPGSMFYNDPVSGIFDIGIRRLRMQAYGQISDRVFLYT